MTKVHIDAVMPLWIEKLIKRFCYPFFIIPVEEEELISTLIEKEFYDTARMFIGWAERAWGTSTFTVRLSTRIDRITFLKENK